MGFVFTCSWIVLDNISTGAIRSHNKQKAYLCLSNPYTSRQDGYFRFFRLSFSDSKKTVIKPRRKWKKKLRREEIGPGFLAKEEKGGDSIENK